MTRWQIYVRDAALNRQGEVDDFTSLEATRRWNDIGTWTLSVDRRSPQAGTLRQSGAGILITRDGQTWMSGPWTQAEHNVKGSQEILTLTGKDDTVWLQRRLASPSPTESAPPYVIQADDVRTGVASTVLRQYVNVNLGAGAIGVRKRADVTLGTDPLTGSTVTGRARWQVLLALLQDLATTGGIGFRLVQNALHLEFQTFAITDKTTSVRFSRATGNLADFDFVETAPTGNYFYVGGSGDGLARTIYEQSDSSAVAEWGRIEGELVDQQGTAVTTELAQAASDAIIAQGAKSTLTATLIDTPTIAYYRDYDLGTKVSVELDNPGSIDIVQDIVRRVTLKSSGGSFLVTPAVGTEGTQDNGLRIYQTVRQLRERVINLERR